MFGIFAILNFPINLFATTFALNNGITNNDRSKIELSTTNLVHFLLLEKIQF